MFLFLRMMLAHFIADYPLQTNRVYCYKISSFNGQLFHAGIHAFVFALFLIPYWHHPVTWLYLFWITASHLTFDILKVKAIDKTKLHPVITYTLDQVLHVAAASVVLWLPLAQEIPPIAASGLWSWYWNNTVVAYVIGVIFATYFTTYFLACWHWAKKKLAHDDGYNLTPLQKYYEFFERGVITTLVAFFGDLGLAGIPLVIALRFPTHRGLHRKGKRAAWLRSMPDMVVGILLSIAAGIFIQMISRAHN